MVWEKVMIFQVIKSENFNYTNTNFIDNKLYFAYSKIGSLMRDNFMGPVDCGSFGDTKKLAQKKSFAESIERRALVDTKNSTKDNKEKAFNILKRKIESIPRMATVYSHGEFITDTTGAAAHSDSDQCLLNSLTELLEKNATYLFWYGLSGYRLKNDDLKKYQLYEFITQKGFKLEGFINVDFYPLIVTYIKISNFTPGLSLSTTFGVGASISLDKSIKKALKESFFLTNMHTESYLRQTNQSFATDSYENKISDLLIDTNLFNDLNNLKFKDLKNFACSYKEEIEAKEEIRIIIKTLPQWIENIWIVVKPQLLQKNMIVMKAYSDNLLNSVPFKNNINLNLNINRFTLNLSADELAEKPDCPIL